MSESTVYRVLKRTGLVKPAEVVGFAAGKEYQHKTSRPNQMWAADGAYLKVVGWGWHYLATVLDDYSRFILAWRLQTDMTATSLIEVAQEAVALTGMTKVPVVDRTALLTEHGPGYLSRAFTEHLGLVGLRHIVASPYHPQTNGKCERYHRTVKSQVRLVPYTAPSALREAVAAFVDFYNHQPLPRGSGKRDPCRRLLWLAGGHPRPKEGGEAAHHRGQKKVQPAETIG